MDTVKKSAWSTASISNVNWELLFRAESILMFVSPTILVIIEEMLGNF
jgi:hypothetical protein